MKIKTEIANEILANFGISRPSSVYERWHKGDHFLLEDFDSVLFESKYILAIDWRAYLTDELEDIVSLLPDFGLKAEFDPDESEHEAVITCNGKSEKVKYCPSDEDDFTDVIRALQRLTADRVEFRESPDNGGSDTWIFAMNGPTEWKELDTLAPEVINHFFRKLSP